LSAASEFSLLEGIACQASTLDVQPAYPSADRLFRMEPSFWAASRATRENAVTAGAPLPKAHDEPDVSKSKQTQLPPTLAELKRVGEQFSRELKSADCIIAELDTSSLEVG
jgi:hypothetical protein